VAWPPWPRQDQGRDRQRRKQLPVAHGILANNALALAFEAAHSELPDFAQLQQKYGNSKFAIVPVLTGARKQMTPAVTAQMFAYIHASVFEPLIEQHFGSRLMDEMAVQSGHRVAIPCNLLVAPDGHVVAREVGLKATPDDDAAPADVQAARPGRIARAEAGDIQSLWGLQAGEEFAAAMANGFLA